MKNSLQKNTLIIGNKIKTVGLFITEENPAKMIFNKKEIDIKTLSLLEAELMVQNGCRFLEKIEEPKKEPKTEPSKLKK
jgi:hypothetical protein